MKILVSGQSNTIGRNVGGSTIPDSKVKFWNNTNPLGQNGNTFIVPILGNDPFDTPTANNNFSLWFAHRLAVILNTEINVCLIARGSTNISWWSESGAMYAEIESVLNASNNYPADVALWHQGESDEVNTKAYYKSAFLDYDSRLRADGYLSVNAPHIIGGIPKQSASHIDQALRELAEENENIYYADISDLSTDSGGVHFTGNDLVRLGYSRYFNEYLKYNNLYQGEEMQEYFIATEELPSGTDAGSFISGSYITRDLNTVKKQLNGASLIDKIVHLPEGEYYIDAFSEAFAVGRNQAKLINADTGETLGIGSCEFSSTSSSSSVKSVIKCYLIIPAQGIDIKLQHICQTTRSGNGLGVSNSLSNENGIFSSIIACKIS